MTTDPPQAPFLIRALWFLLVGWWLSGIWAGIALPAVTTLFRYS